MFPKGSKSMDENSHMPGVILFFLSFFQVFYERFRTSFDFLNYKIAEDLRVAVSITNFIMVAITLICLDIIKCIKKL